MKTRLALARSVLHDPELLLYDEPTSGLDPESSHAVLELIREMTAEGRTVVMCTHLLVEAEGLADQVVVLEDGTDLLSGTPGGAHPPLLARRTWCTSTPRTRRCSTASRKCDGVHRLETERPNRPGVVAGAARRPRPRPRPGRPRSSPRACASPGSSPTSPTLEDLYFAVRRDHRERQQAAERQGLAPVRPPTQLDALAEAEEIR